MKKELTLSNISKQYKDITAVDNVTITFTQGIWGVLGANGAGKTTLMRIIAGILEPNTGTVQYNGQLISKLGGSYRNIFGYLPQTFGYHASFTVNDYLEYIAALKDVPKSKSKSKIEDILEALSLTDVKKKTISKLSGGMQRRVGIAQAILNNPDVLVLDEPTSGLDPAERIRFRKFITEFAQHNIVIISTHIVSDIEYISSQNIIMKNGSIIAKGKADTLVSQLEGKVWSGTIAASQIEMLESKACVINLRNEEGGSFTARYISDKALIEKSHLVSPRLEDLYLWLFKDSLQTDSYA